MGCSVIMRNPLLFLAFIVPIVSFQVDSAASGPLARHLSSLLKWTGSSKTPQPDGNAIQFESGYLVETIVEGNEIGMVPYKIRVSEDGELFAVDSVNSNVVKVSPPLSRYSRARLVAGSFQGYKGHVDGKPSDARFNQPKGITIDDKGNVYVADTLNLAIRKIVDAGVTTIAGGKTNVPGYSDGPGEEAKFSNDFDVIYVRRTCSLLVVDRGNAALRQISLNKEDCDYQYGSVSTSDVAMFIGALLIGYFTYMLQHGFRLSFFTFMSEHLETETKELSKGKQTKLVSTIKEETWWESFGQVVAELYKQAIELLPGNLKSFLRPYFRSEDNKEKGLTPLKDALKMPEDEIKTNVSLKQKTVTPLSETKHASIKHDELKPPKMKSSIKNPSLLNKHSHSGQEYAEFYGTGMVSSSLSRSKGQKDRSRHRQKEKGLDILTGTLGAEPKLAEMRTDYNEPKFDQYNIRNKYRYDSSSFHF
ncbi:uncharacterized protein LOC101206392 isoform X2 [Cucumis sativus]|uniref:uncharacterized protein LOC101206392 isoform X2 n=1 Tax=Cucumis sativus TaxID=3659 RepID=UPI0005ECE4F5|nr:uncharacterized protein LOC101206392 isoform X2 [Cucumis sativus]KAE8649823.1 hypothetical protein Csa_012199 [Cucumis sativus]